MNRLPSQSTMSRVCSAGVAVAFVVSASEHIDHPFAFLDSVYGYQLAPAWLGPWLAGFLPFLLLTLAACLLLRRWVETAYVLSILTLISLLAAQISSVARGLNIACGCFGHASDEPIGWKSISIATSCLIALVLGLTFELRSNYSRNRAGAGLREATTTNQFVTGGSHA